MQFKIPQNVQREDTIVGPITFKQLAILLIGGGFTYAIYILLARGYLWTVWAPPVVFFGLLTLAVAFLKIQDMTFLQAALYFVEYVFKPRMRFWRQGDAEIRLSVLKPLPHEVKQAEKAEAELSDLDKRKKLMKLSKSVDRLNNVNSNQ